MILRSVNITYLTIRKGQDTDDEEERDNNQQANAQVFVRVLIIPATMQYHTKEMINSTQRTKKLIERQDKSKSRGLRFTWWTQST